MIFIAFTKLDIDQFLLIRKESDIILAYSDIISAENSEHVFDVSTLDIDWSDYVLIVRDFFERIHHRDNYDLKGYANNFFECTIKTICFYILAVNRFESKHEQIYFHHKLICPGFLNYYLAEHESQGRILYNRNVAFQKSIELHLNNIGKKIIYGGLKVAFPRVKNLVRDASVLFAKFLQCLKQNSISDRCSTIDNDFVEFIFNIRSLSQFDALKLIIQSSKYRCTIICSSSFLDKNLYSHISTWSQNFEHIKVVCLPRVSHKQVLNHFAKIFSFLNFSEKYISFTDFKLNVAQSLREISIMSAELSFYEYRLDKLLPFQNKIRSIFITCEQKSPHGYVDVKVAASKNFKTVQIMSCDQASSDLPYTIYADLFLVDTLKRLELFKNNWSTNTDKIAYLGSIRKIDNFTLMPTVFKFDFCYFADSDNVIHNKNVIGFLQGIQSINPDFKFCIKLHPRDSGSWVSPDLYDLGLVYKSYSIQLDNLYSLFKVAISNPSAVVLDFISKNKPFIFLDILSNYNKNDFVSCDDSYLGYVTNFQDFRNLLVQDLNLVPHFEALRNRIFGTNVSMLSVQDIKEKFKKA